LKTREAYNKNVKRTEAKIGDPSDKVKGIVATVVIFTAMTVMIAVTTDRLILLLFLIGIPIMLLAGLFYISEMRKDEVVKEVAIHRRNAAGPSSALNLPAQLQERLNKMYRSSNTFNDSPAYYGRASACGVSPYTYTHGGAALGGGAGEAGEGGDGDW
jgi:hypothetical protein